MHTRCSWCREAINNHSRELAHGGARPCRTPNSTASKKQNLLATAAAGLCSHRKLLLQRYGPLESRCMQACSKSGSLCTACVVCLAACCQCTASNVHNSIAMPASPSRPVRLTTGSCNKHCATADSSWLRNEASCPESEGKCPERASS